MPRHDETRTDGRGRAWWLRAAGTPASSPFFEPFLLGLGSRRLDLCLSLLVVAAVVVTRLAAFPAGAWEQDEAYFACGVTDFDVERNHPHPPWFPLWIGLGKALLPMAGDPVRALQLASLVASIWLLFPLVSLWSLWLRRDLALASSLLFLMLPGTVYLSGRAFTEPTATALLVVAAALLLGEDRSARSWIAGSLAAGCTLLVRAHFALPVAGLLGYRMVHAQSRAERRRIGLPAVLAVVGGYLPVAVSAGGPAPLAAALAAHSRYHFHALAGAGLTLADQGLARALVLPSLAVLWIALAGAGAVTLWRWRRHVPGAVVLVLAALAPLIATVHGLAFAGHLRYALPILALSAGLIGVGVARLAGRSALPLLAIAAVAAAVLLQPSWAVYRREPSPPVRALDYALGEARRSGSVLVADHTLHAFLELKRVRHGLPLTLLWADQISRGETVPPPDWATVAIFDAGGGDVVVSAARTVTFSCEDRRLRRLSQGRFLDLEVAVGARTRAAPPTR